MENKRKIILLTILGLGLTVILVLVGFGNWLHRLREEEVKVVPVEKEGEDLLLEEGPPAEFNPLGIEIPGEVHYYIGVIKRKTADTLIIEVKASDNYLTRDQDLTVQINQNTRLVKYRLPSIYLKQGQRPEDFVSRSPTLDDFAVGERVTVYANENIRDQREFVANEVRAVGYD